MPANIRAYIFIVAIALFSLFFIKKITANLISTAEFKKWQTSWLAVTSFAFLSFNFWLYAIAMFFYLLFTNGKKTHTLGLYVAILFAVPLVPGYIPGFGLVNYLFALDHIRILNLTLLLSMLFTPNEHKTLALGKVKTDFFLIGFIALGSILDFRDSSFTDGLRGGFYNFIDVYIPYYIFSRKIQTFEDIKIVLTAFLFACIIAGNIGIFENIRSWLVYADLNKTWRLAWAWSGGYLGREGSIRAVSSFGHSILFGTMMTFAIGVFLFLQRYVKNKTIKRICWAMLILGLLAPISRGPWVGAVIMLVTFILFGKNALKNMTQFIAVSLAGLMILAASPFGSKVINYIPGLGNVDSGNVEYREKLIDVSFLVIAKNPIFGDTSYLEDPLMEEMRQGQGIIDVVNAYLAVALSNGFVGLFLFLGMFISTLAMIYKAMKLVKGKSEEYHLLGRCLLAIIVASMFMIGSSGNQLALKTINWCLLGIGIAYWQIVKLQFSNKQFQPAVKVTESI